MRNAWGDAQHSDGGNQVNLYMASARKTPGEKNEGRWVGVRELPIFCLYPTNFSPTPHHLNAWNRLGGYIKTFTKTFVFVVGQ